MIFAPNQISEDMLGIKIEVLLEEITEINRKTIKSWIDGTRQPHNSTLLKAFHKVNSKVENDYGVKLGLNMKMYNESKPGPAWKTLFEHPINQNNFAYIPETKKLILFFEKTIREFRASVKKHDKNEVEKKIKSYLRTIDLPALNLMDYLNKYYQECIQNEKKNEQIWVGLRAKLTLYCIASFDAELFSFIDDFSVYGELGETYKKRQSLYCPLLPEYKSECGKTVPPRKNWYEKIKIKSGYKSWGKLAEALGNNPELGISNISDKDFRRYKNGEIFPSLKKIKLILKGLFPEDKQFDGLMYYFIAQIFQYFYDIIQGLGEVDTLEFFNEYHNYINYFAKKYTAPVSD